MSVRGALAFLLLALAFVLASWLGWWAVPVVAAAWGFLRPAVRRPILTAALAAGLAWAAWLLWDFGRDPAAFARLTGRLGAVFPLPSALLLLLTLLLAALLAWCAAAVGCWLGGALASNPHER